MCDDATNFSERKVLGTYLFSPYSVYTVYSTLDTLHFNNKY